MKRAFDIIFSFVGLIVLSPLFIIVAILIKVDNIGSVFFTHERVGKDFKPFRLFKFRTMVSDAPGAGLPATAGKDPRVTKLGRFLRKVKIAELPQLWNILRGDMSFVGPRAEVEKYVTKHRKDYEEILKVRPGITGRASWSYSDEESVLKDKEDPDEYYIHVLLPEKIKHARRYIKEMSLAYDIRLILSTIFKLTYPHNFINKVMNSAPPYRKLFVVGIQLCVFIISNYLAFSIRFDADVPPSEFHSFLTYLPLLLILRIIFLFVFSLDRGLWKYASVSDLRNIIVSISFGSIFFVLTTRYLLGFTLYPRSIFIIDWFLNIFFLGGIRMFRRLHNVANDQRPRKRVIVVGAGAAADMLLRDVEHSHFCPYEIIGLIDDDPQKKGSKLRGIPILGTRKDLKAIMEKEEPEEFIVAIPSIDSLRLQSLVKDLRQYSRPIKTLPGLWSIISGKTSLSDIKEMAPEDVLFRAPTSGGDEDSKTFFEGKRVMITGAGGSIGSELSRQIASFKPERLILFERHEKSLYDLDMELKPMVYSQNGKKMEVHSVIGDILDEKRVAETMEKFRPEVVFHAAAYKHVPLMEDNPYEAFKTNVLGTKMVNEKSREAGVNKFILISTDKAVNPANVMGTTKKMAEEILCDASEDGNATKDITVRFGNVLGSSGSVVPLFAEQIKRGGPVTVTHPEVTRYFMTISEAVNLVLQAAVMGSGGEVFVLDMGKPVKIVDLAKRMIDLYGYRLGVDMDISFIGLRPGEKLREELINSFEVIEKTAHPKIRKAVSNGSVNKNIPELLRNPEFLGDDSSIKNILNAYIDPDLATKKWIQS